MCGKCHVCLGPLWVRETEGGGKQREGGSVKLESPEDIIDPGY